MGGETQDVTITDHQGLLAPCNGHCIRGSTTDENGRNHCQDKDFHISHIALVLVSLCKVNKKKRNEQILTKKNGDLLHRRPPNKPIKNFYITNLLVQATVVHRGVEQHEIRTHLLVVEHIAHPLHIVVDGTGHQTLTVCVAVLGSEHQL